MDWVEEFAQDTEFQCCLVLNAKLCFYIEPDGKMRKSNVIPSGGTIVHWSKFQRGLVRCEGEGDLNPFYAPTRRNRVHYTLEQFPEIIGFCERDEESYSAGNGIESYDYKLDGELVYRATKTNQGWRIEEFEEGKCVAVSVGEELGMTLFEALHFGPSRDDTFCSILIPVLKKEREKIIALMYYFGGYPGSYLRNTPEFEIVRERLLPEDICLLSYAKIPKQYFQYLGDILLEALAEPCIGKYLYYGFDPSDWETMAGARN